MIALDFDPKAIVNAAVQRGLCSPPRVTPHFTDSSIKIVRERDGRYLRSSFPETFQRILNRFLDRHEIEFTADDLMAFATREGKHYSRFSVTYYLRSACRENIVTMTFNAKGQRRKQGRPAFSRYQKANP